MIWTLYGLVITGILVGNLTSSLTASVEFTLNDVDLYEAQVKHSSSSLYLRTNLVIAPF